VYGRKSDVGPPHAVGVAHFTQPAEEVAAYLLDPNNMGDWNEELCEKGQVLRMINDDAALGYLDYYGVSALGLSIVKPRVRAAHACARRREPNSPAVCLRCTAADRASRG